MLPFLQA
jgi:hypothetical protein